MKISKQVCGVTGEYYVAAEFSRRGYLAAITLRNSDGADILVSNIAGDKLISVQVKTTQNKEKWILSQKVEKEISENKYFIFVNIPADITEMPKYKIVSAKTLAKNIFDGHRRWLDEPGKIRNDSAVRQFDPRYFSKSEILSWQNLIDIIESK